MRVMVKDTFMCVCVQNVFSILLYGKTVLKLFLNGVCFCLLFSRLGFGFPIIGVCQIVLSCEWVFMCACI